MLPFYLHGCRSSIRTSIGETPFSLVYGMEVGLSVEVQIPYLRIMKDAAWTKINRFRLGWISLT